MAYAFNDDKSKFDLEETVDNVDNLIGNMATIETSPVITNHSVGEYIMYNGVLLKVLSPIATGENLVLGTNVTPINFGNEIKVLRDFVNNQVVSSYGDMHGFLASYNSTDHLFGIGSTVINPNNSTYRGHKVGLVVTNSGLSLYDHNTGTWIWGNH